jgi:putative ABC transport system permease protein
LSGPFYALISPERAEALGFDVVTTGAILRNPTDLTGSQRARLQQIVTGDLALLSAFVEPGDASTTGPDANAPQSGVELRIASIADPVPVALMNGLIVAAAVLLTLLVVAIGLSLSATESRDERDVLVAVGAPPRTLSRVAGAKALVLAATGVALAVPTGYVPTWVLYRTTDETRVPFPWLTVGLIVLVVPVVAGLAAWATSGVARRFRPVRMSTLAAD